MSLKNWLHTMKSKCLPPSARKVMRMEKTLLCRLDELSAQHGYLDGQIKALSARNDLLFWFSQMREGEGLARTKRNFFERLVPEEGLIRGGQLIMLNLLDFLDDVCTENGLAYVLAHGTLLGAVRHKGFIPWDDDVDIFMMREDFLKFEKIIKNQSRYCIMDLYFVDDKKNKCARSKVLRDTKINLNIWIDILILDNTIIDDESSRKKQAKRIELSKKVWDITQKSGWAVKFYPIYNLAIKSKLDAVFDEYIYPCQKEGTFIESVWGWYSFKKEDVFPVKRMPFEANVLREDERASGKKKKKREFCVPKNPEALLSRYGDIMKIPDGPYSYRHAKYFDFYGKEDIIEEYLKTWGCADQKG
ncbi:LicD family protein [uncultured Mailhella sp.]|uniref:LicD family protein n=1 Tax=uncultured Mailhella sp. TaxID=1981031 RepID=UPI00261BF157|nr:LicD family protein [uncultured Mailhella sp.]